MTKHSVKSVLSIATCAAALFGSSAYAAASPLDPPPAFCSGTVGTSTTDWKSATCNAAGDTEIGLYWGGGNGNINVSVWQGASPSEGSKWFGSGLDSGSACIDLDGGNFWVEFSSVNPLAKNVKKGLYFEAKHTCP